MNQQQLVGGRVFMLDGREISSYIIIPPLYMQLHESSCGSMPLPLWLVGPLKAEAKIVLPKQTPLRDPYKCTNLCYNLLSWTQ